MADTVDEQIARIRCKLDELRSREKRASRDKRHGFRLSPPLPEEKLLEFEERFAVALPEPYRRFLLSAGNGGTGPTYGLYPFEKCWASEEYGKKTHGAGHLTQDCPMWPGMPAGIGAEAGEADIWDYLLRGCLIIADEGCSCLIVLIVSGKYRGRVAHVDTEQDGGPCVTQDVDFLAWYERWLDTLLWGWDDRFFGPGLPGDAARMLEILQDTSSALDIQAEALCTVQRMPSLTDELSAVVLRSLESPGASVREKAACVAAKHQLAAAVPGLLTLLTDSNADVRLAAIHALRKTRPTSLWTEQVRRSLGDCEHDVVFWALCSLIEAKGLTREDLLPLVTGPDIKNRRSAIFAWGKMGFSLTGESWTEAIANNEDAMVRHEFVNALRSAKDPRTDEILQRMQDCYPDDPLFKQQSSPAIKVLPELWRFVIWMVTRAVPFLGAYVLHQIKKVLCRK